MSATTAFPLDAVRASFPSLGADKEYIFCENAGGSQVLGAVAELVKDYLLSSNVQMANYDLAKRAAARIERGHAAAALFSGANSTDEIMNGASATQLAETLSRMIEATVIKQRKGEYKGEEPMWNEGDEIIISEADHETNRGAWIRLAERQGFTIKEWKVSPIEGQGGSNPFAVELSLKELEKLVTPRTRLVAFTACSNVLGGLTPIREAAALIKQKSQGNAWVAIDAVAYAPHRQVTPQEWGVDFVLFSWYKVYCAHIGSLYISPRASKQLLTKLNHHFLHEHHGTYPFQPSSQQYELIAALAPVVEYLASIGQGCSPTPVDFTKLLGTSSSGAYVSKEEVNGIEKEAADSASKEEFLGTLRKSFAAIAQHEEALQKELIGFLTSKEMRDAGVRIVGNESASSAVRAPTVAFVVLDKSVPSKTRSSAELHRAIVANGKLGMQQGHMYAYALVKALGLPIDDGVVRLSLVHYNSVEEVKKVCQLLRGAILA